MILADTNRDGKVDVQGETDSAGKETWTNEVGALFLANIGDTKKRCSSQMNLTEIFNDRNFPRQELDKCNDASDNVLRNAKYLAPLRTRPMADLSSAATGSVVVVGAEAAKNTRIFHKAGSDWLYVSSNYTFTAQDLKAGLELGIDGRDVRRPGGWDGKAVVEFRLKDGDKAASDKVALRVAPVLTHHHLQFADEVISPEPQPDGKGTRFNTDLAAALKKSGLQQPLRLLHMDTFLQDFFEPGYASIPGPDGPVVLRIVIRPSSHIQGGVNMYKDLRGDSVGAVQHYDVEQADEDKEATGNLEAIPPYTHKGQKYPAGRVIMGSRAGNRPKLLKFLEAQETQKPLELDTTWLYIGHVDEFLQFLPANNERGWVVAVDDPLAGLAILEEVQKDGLGGSVKALSRPSLPTDTNDQKTYNDPLPTITVDQLLGKANFSRVQDFAARHIKKNIDILKAEVGLTDAEILRIPALYYNEPMAHKRRWQAVRYLPDLDKEAEQQKSISTAFQVYSMYPGTINNLVVNTHIVAPDPWGPVVNGKDVLKEAISAQYAKINITVHYVDDWYSHHVSLGEIHCGTNSLRNPTAPWW